MRIDKLTLRNFKGFENQEFQFHPQFNLLVGDNASGKTSILDAAAVAMGSWFLGMPGQETRHIRTEDIRIRTDYGKTKHEISQQFPVEIEAIGQVGGENIRWHRTLTAPDGRTTRTHAASIRAIAEQHQQKVMRGEPVVLPVLSYYGSGRLWLEPKDTQRNKSDIAPQEIPDLPDDANFFARRLIGYRYSVDDRCSPRDLLRWMRYQRRIEVDEGEISVPYRVVIESLKHCLGSKRIEISLRYGTLMVDLPEVGFVPFARLSDGYRNIVAMVGDLAYKCAVLNPDLEERALVETPGVVLVDELDLYLHPNWQRRVIEDLRTTFPKIQFICTTHSPFLIQALRSGEELIALGGVATASMGNKSLDDIALSIMGVREPETSARYSAMKQVARQYLASLEDGTKLPEDRLEAFLDRLAQSIGPFADNPAYQAFLEMNRVAKVGK